jgi:hypothetical protein
MLIKLIFNNNLSSDYIKNFYKSPKGTCLNSSFASNITPKKIINEYGLYISFWHIDNIALIKYYGNKVSINSLMTFTGIISVKVISEDNIIFDDLSENEICTILGYPFTI